MLSFLIKADAFPELLVCEVEDSAARGSRKRRWILHADQTVLNDIVDADAVLAAELVQSLR